MPKRNGNGGDAAAPSRVYLAGFGERVRRLRERQAVTLKQLAQLSGLSDRYIIEVEKGEANPSLASVLSLSRALQTSVTGLLPEDSKSHAPESRGAAQEILELLEDRPKEQISRVLAAVSDFLEHPRKRHIALTGMRGAGKTTVGQLLARHMGVPFYELDELIEKNTGLSLAEIFDLEGEQYYRAVEEKTLQRALAQPSGVIAAGGGLVLNPAALLLLKLHASIVWLQASPEVLIARVRRGKDRSRLGDYPHVSKQLHAILERRTPYYAKADMVLDTTHKSPDHIVHAIAHELQSVKHPGDAGNQRNAFHSSERSRPKIK